MECRRFTAMPLYPGFVGQALEYVGITVSSLAIVETERDEVQDDAYDLWFLNLTDHFSQVGLLERKNFLNPPHLGRGRNVFDEKMLPQVDSIPRSMWDNNASGGDIIRK